MLPARHRIVRLACVMAGLLIVHLVPAAQRAPVRLIPGPAGTPRSGLAPSPQEALAYFRARIAAERELSVIVEVRAPELQPADTDAAAESAEPDPDRELAEVAILREARQRVIRRLPPRTEPVREYDAIPFFTLLADAATFEVLLSDPNVVSIQEDFSVPPALADSIPLIQADTAWAVGYSGGDIAVAVLDSGAEKAHPIFTGGVVSEACYSGGGKKAASLCKNGALSSTANGSGAPCTLNESCSHGTHVTAIAAGDTGVARLSSIISMQVFSKEPANEGGLGAAASDLVKALERVHTLRTKYSIASVNMSIGGGGYTKTCDSVSPAMVAIIKKLYDARIAVVIASGNDGYVNSISWPACMTKVISVGNTTKSDQIAVSSNEASFMSLMAPGSSIRAAVPGGSYGYKTGTSMAAPHVAGTWALLVDKTPSLTVAAGLSALKSTGLGIRATSINTTFRRVRVNDALNKLKKATASTLTSPSGTSPSTKPKYTWKKVAAATDYRLWVEVAGSDKAKINTWYKSNDVCTGTTCSVTPNVALAAGQTYDWWIQTFEFRIGPWSVGKAFITPGGAAGATALMSPPLVPGGNLIKKITRD
ncbi:MAG: S8 family serine peptidase [Acidobacteriota bacterium]|nr:S8 family serine peptidase [Acidobacteriota bacterium]